MTHSVAAGVALMNLLAKPDARDFMSLPFQEIDFLENLETDPDQNLKNLRIGFLPDMKAGLPVNAEVAAAAAAASKALAGAGAIVEQMPSFLTEELLDGMCRFFEARSYNDYQQLTPAQQAKVLPFIAEWSTWRAKNFSGRDVMAAYNCYVALRDATVRACQPYDFV